MVPVPAQIIDDQRPRPIRNLMVATKAYGAANAVKSLLHRFDNSAENNIIVLCNGALSVRDELSRLLAESELHAQLILATTTHGAYQEKGEDEMYRVVHAGQGSTFVEEHPSLSQLWDQSGLGSKSISSLEMDVLLWQKLAANCAINPTTALYKCKNGEILAHQANSNTMPSVEEVIQEVSSVAVQSSPHSSELDFESLRAFVFKVIDDTSQNRSSMLQDVTNGQPTEVDYLNGYVVARGKALGIDTPANTSLFTQIQDLHRTFSAKVG